MKRKGKIYIGTSGWHYKHWIGTYYPKGTKDADQLSLYLDDFKTVEINNSFYRLPTPETFTSWRKAVPKDFLFSVKVSRFITHMKKLNVDKATIDQFIDRAIRLKRKLGPLLFQLPPKWNLNAERLERLLKKLPTGYRYTFEFRNTSWYTEEIYDLLKKHNVAFCIYELDGHISPKLVTADFVYVRLHGPGRKYQGRYSLPALRKWGADCIKWMNEGREVYVYFDNDQLGYAAFNAKELVKLTGDGEK